MVFHRLKPSLAAFLSSVAPPSLAAILLVVAGGCSSSEGDAQVPAGSGGHDTAASGGVTGSGGDTNTGGAVGTGGGGSNVVPVEGDAPTVHLTYQRDDSVFINPERGFYTYASLTDTDNFDYVRQEGLSLAYTNVELAEYLGNDHEQDLPADLLSAIAAGFDAVRAAHIKAIVRFRYDSGDGYPDGANDAPESWILRHIEQLAPMLQANEDVIFQLQAGFIGAWGEWHTSNNFSDGEDDAEARKRVVDALLLALPATRRTGVRYPAYKRMFYGNTAATLQDVLSNAAIARVGHLNDCFVSGAEDVGTYQYESIDILQAYLAQDSAFVPVGGETCAVHARNECSVALGEMERFHYTYLNQDYHPDVLSSWETNGCLREMQSRLGYRLNLVSATVPEAVRPGGRFVMNLTLENSGFAALTNPRPVILVLDGETTRLQVELPSDPRAYLPGVTTIQARLQLPADLPEGTYRLALWLPDAADALSQQVEYSVRIFGNDVWNPATGDNTLSMVAIDDTASGDVDSSADAFRVID